ncbi:uncharacterized protein MYCFIDRAFT_55669 [Pseudocercospora fijiensis CIRAD86]|uniref:Vacuolar protein sorting/targeting protein 10 n=1 Tax=Pseudocercospora fijiensis (strain CIRAD86) TaxID=383855 RepID=N1Q8K9_PSEFD|nr:uncharacterized protein MYCFIDRAFT_55669 [Pseudocercospora fijiensis CIRAD86]EME89230.1 hypothetical protein MYCFIDRAFT_55669 [Pseudocercospora fijiensis CIRAD86]
MRLLLPGVLLSLLALSGTAVAKDTPDLEETKFDTQPANVLYFEDSDVILTTNPDTKVTYRSPDGGKTWKPLDGVEKGEIMEVLKHPYDHKLAVVLGSKKKHWITRDRGETWKQFETDESPSRMRPGIVFHATDPDRMIFQGGNCLGLLCEDFIYYTTDGFKTKPKLLDKDVITCLWSKSTPLFTTGDEEKDKNSIICVAPGKFSLFSSNNRVIITEDFFKTDGREPKMSDGKTVEGITNLASVKKYLVFAAKSERTTEMAMYVSDDTVTWHRAEFGEHRLEEDAYTLLESTNYSMQVDVMTTKAQNPMGVLLTSNSNGTFFTKNIEHTNRNVRGYVDFEKISNIQGIVLVNTVDNWEEVEAKWSVEKKVVSQISFDDGRTWQDLKADGKKLHLHSITNQRNMGRVFSSPAPGIVMGVGNTGNYLNPYDEGDTYISDDAGVTWQKALDKPHLYEFGAQGSVIVAVEDGETKKLKWSLDHGKKWEEMELKDKIKPYTLTTTPDSTSLKFLMLATKRVDSKTEHFTYALDFNGLHESTCKKDDLEKWPARVDSDGKATCIMGHKQFFTRRKADAKCLVENKDFEDPEEDRENCKCSREDFECDYNFKREDGKCVQSGPIVAPEGACSGDKKKFMGTSGYRLIPGNTCSGGENLAEEVERDCTDTKTPPTSGEIATEITTFDADKVIEYYYLEREESDSGHDESIIMRTDRREVYVTHDHGKKWERIMKDEEILAVYPHQYMTSYVYLITAGKDVHYSTNRAQSWGKFQAPEAPNHNDIQVLTFHPTQKDWLIWTGGKDCDTHKQNCKTIAQVSKSGGEDWETLLRAVRKCQFVYREGRQNSDQLVYCEQYENENRDSSLLLMSSTDWFDHKKELKRDVISFATMAEFIVVAIRDDQQKTLRVDASIDGVTFADAHFPPNFNVEHQQAYTVLDSSTHAVFLHVTVNPKEDQEYGAIVKSNSNGTSYVMSASEVNRNRAGYVDFEKMQGLEGVAIINRVANAHDADKGKAKKLRTYMTHNDGGDWALIGRPREPPKDMDVKFGCSGSNVEECSLHLHGYTERKDPRDTYSSPSAVGLMIGTGNVGEYLEYKKDADTFITRDGGLSWEVIAKGNWMWEYGDQGSIIVIVKENEVTDRVRYSLDEGQTWKEYRFGKEMTVTDISTVPSDTSRNFLLWGRIGNKVATVNLDFSGLKERSRQCKIDEDNPSSKDQDYHLWSPSHPMSEDNCLFGHVAEYHRKNLDSDCYNGREIKHLHNIAKNCSCTREDFECDYNYQRDSTGACRLVEGLDPPDPKAVCEKDKDAIEYFDITGYRRIPLTTCQGGKELDYTSNVKPCPGKEGDFEKKHAISGAGLFFAIAIPIAAAAGVGYWVYKNWDGKFGRIRLGDSVGGYGGGAFDGEQPWIKYPVMAISALVAVVAALPMLVGSVWRAVSTRMGRSSGSYARVGTPYTSRSSFSRGRADYSVGVDEDEGELLGEDSDEDV